MKTRFTAIFLALALTIGLIIPAFAADTVTPYTYEGGDFRVTNTIEHSEWDGGGLGAPLTCVAPVEITLLNDTSVFSGMTEDEYFGDRGEELEVLNKSTYHNPIHVEESYQEMIRAGAKIILTEPGIYVIRSIKCWHEDEHTYQCDISLGALCITVVAADNSNISTPENPDNPSTPPEQPTTPPTNADSYPYSIPGTPDFLRFSVSPIGSYRTTVPEFDANDNLYDKEVTVYEFVVGTKLGLTGEGIQKGYSIANLSSDDFENIDRSEFTLTKGSLTEQWYFVNSANDPEGFIAYIHPVNTNTVFQDVAAGEYYEDAVKWAMKYGITNGTSSTSFTPGRTCSNAEILTMVYRAFEWMPVLGGNPFADVKQSDYYYQAARWAAEYDIVSGATFDPDKPCTRAMAMTYIWKALMSPDAGGSTNFTDVHGGADYAKAVAWAVEAGVTNGTSATTFSPNDTCTRGQIVTFLYRAMG